MSVQTAALGAAVVGLGVGTAHARALAADPRCKLLSVCDLDRGRAQALADSLGTGVASDFEAVLRDPAVKVVCLASFDQDHAAQAEAALAAGKHVFVEKPLFRTPAELKALAAAQRRAGAHLASNLVLRAAPLFRWLKEAVDAGRLGRLYAIDGDYLSGRLSKITEGWRKDVPDYSVMQGGGIHVLDLLLWLAGERPESVASSGNRLSTDGTAFRHDDFHAADFRFPSGLVGRVTANFACVHRHQHVLRVFGTKGTFLLDDMGARLHESRAPEAAPVRLDAPAAPPDKGALLPDFIGAIVSGADPGPAARREFDLIAACLAADAAKSAQSRIPVGYST